MVHISKRTGKLISMAQVLGLIVQLQNRSLYDCIPNLGSWDTFAPLGIEEFAVLSFWQTNSHQVNVFNLDWAPSPELRVFSEC